MESSRPSALLRQASEWCASQRLRARVSTHLHKCRFMQGLLSARSSPRHLVACWSAPRLLPVCRRSRIQVCLVASLGRPVLPGWLGFNESPQMTSRDSYEEVGPGTNLSKKQTEMAVATKSAKHLPYSRLLACASRTRRVHTYLGPAAGKCAGRAVFDIGKYGRHARRGKPARLFRDIAIDEGLHTVLEADDDS